MLGLSGELSLAFPRIALFGCRGVCSAWGAAANLFRVLESLKAGKRLPEARFANMRVAPSGQGSVYAAFAKAS